MIGRIAVAFGLSFAVGFEREVRGGAAGDRTFALIGTAAAAIGAIAVARNAIAGVVTGVGSSAARCSSGAKPASCVG
jgi:putative Mg2+ transporter-C (MgtC) family protein